MKKGNFRSLNKSKILITVMVMAMVVIVIIVAYVLLNSKNTDIVERLHLNVWDWIAIILSVFSVVLTIMNWWAQDQTRENTARLKSEDFRNILNGGYYAIVRNMINLYSLEVVLQQRNYSVYPSEEYLQKLKLMFLNPYQSMTRNLSHEYAERLSRLYELCLFFNLHIDSTQKHLGTLKIEPDIKNRDMQNLKSMLWFVASELESTIDFIFPAGESNDNVVMVRDYLCEIIDEISGDPTKRITPIIENYDNIRRMPYIDKDNDFFFRKIFESEKKYYSFMSKLNGLIHFHLGKKKDGYERIPLIPLNDK